MSRNRLGGPRKLAARILLMTFEDLAAGVDKPKGREALEFAGSGWFDFWCDAVDRCPSDVRRRVAGSVGAMGPRAGSPSGGRRTKACQSVRR